MYPNHMLHLQQGAGLPVAIFVITVLALIVVGIAQIQDSTGQSVSLQIQSQRAFYAAESGAQVGLRDALESDSCGAVQSPLAFTSPGLAGCEAQVSCEILVADIQGNGSNDTVYVLISQGSCGTGSPDAATRTIEVRAR
ncbi:hypothetical protein [Marinobacter sediminum]|uniref:hypothetical protein n=1 Tax=Marinobacter sediminum TaxID=256323 RepID=UPI001939F820|nr:hypothetical protein [Marinobacter sediminum]